LHDTIFFDAAITTAETPRLPELRQTDEKAFGRIIDKNSAHARRIFLRYLVKSLQIAPNGAKYMSIRQGVLVLRYGSA
jgi:hypothetical protein